MISRYSKLEDILQLPEMEGRHYMVDPGVEPLLFEILGEESYHTLMAGRKVAEISFQELLDKIFGAWNMPSLLSGLEYLEQKLKEQPVFYDIYTEEELEEDLSRKQTGLAVFPAGSRKPYVMICPGGGYSSVCSIAEGYGIAQKVNELGYPACVLVYRTGADAKYPNPMDDLAQAIRFVSEHAEQLGFDPDGYALMGFSAGGHLAASFGCEYPGYAKYRLPAPKCLILGYPVITMGEYTHVGSREALLGMDECDLPEKRDEFSIEQQLTDKYPPVFVWQCEGDDTVPIENSRLLTDGLKSLAIPYVYEVYPGTSHGWGLGIGTPAEGWLERAVDFWQKQPEQI